jgi:3-hydroxybutyryl-CoA dehydratase
MPAEAGPMLGAPSLVVGATASRSVTFTEETVAAFCAATGDCNPVHLSDEFAATTRFGRRIVNGMLTCALVSSVIGTQLPGPGAPVFIGDEVTATVSVLHMREDRPIVRLRTVCLKAHGEVVLDGEATVLVDTDVGKGA